MKKCKRLLAIVLSVLLIVTAIVPMTVSAGQTNLRNRVVGYFPYYRYDTLSSIDFSALSHCILSFLTYNNGTLTCGFTGDQINAIKAKCDENDVKLMIALGGWEGFKYSNNPIDTDAERAELISDLMYYIDTYDLDGIDIDIEITNSDFWSNFDAFMSELSAELKPDGKLLTMAVSSWFTDGIANSTYDYFDFINLMSYDYSNSDVAPMSQVHSLLSYYSNRGVSNDRMTIGVPFYGYDSSHNAYTYAEIIASNKEATQLDFYNGISYNGQATIAAKAEFSIDYGGIMIWEIGQDSFDPQYSLLQTIKSVYDAEGTGVAPATNLTATNVTYTGASLSWTASEDAVSYNIYNGSTLVGSTSGTSYTVTGLEDGTSYTFKVSAVSAEGVESYTTNVTFETPIDASDIDEWESGSVYTKGMQVVCEGKIYEAQWWTQGDKPTTSTSGAWKYIGEAGSDIVDPTVPATGIVLYKDGAAVVTGGSINVTDADAAMSFTAAILPDNATNKNYTITVSDSAVASVRGTTATVTPANATEDTSVVITAKSEDGAYVVSYTVNIDYTEPVIPDPEPVADDVFVFKINDSNVLYANQNMKFAVDAPAQFVGGKTLVPLRAIGSAVGIDDLVFDSETFEITFTGYDGYKVEMKVGSTECKLTKGSSSMTIQIVAPVLINGITMLPLRDATALVGGTVKFDDLGTTDTGYVVVSGGTFEDADVAGYIAAYEAV